MTLLIPMMSAAPVQLVLLVRDDVVQAAVAMSSSGWSSRHSSAYLFAWMRPPLAQDQRDDLVTALRVQRQCAPQFVIVSAGWAYQIVVMIFMEVSGFEMRQRAWEGAHRNLIPVSGDPARPARAGSVRAVTLGPS